MSRPRYLWRQLTPAQRVETLESRRIHGRPWHSPPHLQVFDGSRHYHVTAACYEHQPVIGLHPERMDEFTGQLLDLLSVHAAQTSAWCVLPNHYHALVEVSDLPGLMRELGQFHGRTSHRWNKQENARGRKVFFRAADRAMRTERHFWATINYIHHNPVHHGYVAKWTDWPWSSASGFLAQFGRDESKRIWLEYPLDEYGRGWDDPDR